MKDELQKLAETENRAKRGKETEVQLWCRKLCLTLCLSPDSGVPERERERERERIKGANI